MPERRKKKNLKATKHRVKRAKSAAARSSKVKKTPKVSKAPKKKAEKAAPISTLTVYDEKGQSHETVALDPLFIGASVNKDVVYQAVLMYQAGEREGTASTKDRGHVRGGGKKPWKQKGTGQARHGSRRSPLWRGGGTTFGPMPRDYSYQLPAQMRRGAVSEGMKDKVIAGKLFLVNDFQVESPKTKWVLELMENLKLEKPLLLVEKKSKNLLLAARNIQGVSIKTAEEVNLMDILTHRECLMTKTAYKGLVNRLSRS